MSEPFTLVRGKRLRVVRLDDCGGLPDAATACSWLVSKGFISVQMTPETADGDDIELRNANGDLEVSDRGRDQLRWWNVEAELTGVDPALLEMTSNVVLEEDWDSNVVGIRSYEGSPSGSFSLEVWAGTGQQCGPGGVVRYGYLLLPFVIPSVLGDITIENGAASLHIKGRTGGGGGWGTGPFDVVPIDGDDTPGKLAVPLGAAEHQLLRSTTIAPPAVTVGCQPMPA